MKCTKCGRHVYSYNQKTNSLSNEIERIYFCKHCHNRFYTLEQIVEKNENEETVQQVQ